MTDELEPVIYKTDTTREELDNPLAVIITEKGYGKDLSYSFNRKVYEIDFAKPVFPQLMALPITDKPIVMWPPGISDDDRIRKTAELHDLWSSALLSYNTFSQQLWPWIANLYTNKERILNALPIDVYAKLLEKGGAPNWRREKARLFSNRKALILGAGDSIRWLEDKDLSNVDIFASWHTLIKWKRNTGKPLKCSLVGHIDWANPWEYKAPLMDGQPVLSIVPISAPVYRHSEDEFARLLIYYNLEHPCSLVAADYTGQEYHRPLSANVGNFLVHNALYLGYKEIGLLGVDCGWSDTQKADAPGEGRVFRVVNSHFNAVYTNEMFQSYLPSFSCFSLVPDLKRYNLSHIGLDLPGWEYKALEEFLAG